MPFAVRAPDDGRTELSWAPADTAGPVAPGALAEAVAAAGVAWTAAGAPRLRRAAADETPQLTIAWHAAADDPCGLFGRGLSVAHAGPCAPQTFIHLDAERTWDAAPGAPPAQSLRLVLAHELGHVLGLDHSPDETSLMSADAQRDTPAPADLAGLHSLRGGGRDAPGDVLIEAADGAARRAPALRAIAPGALTALALFDTDGDGDEELLVWRVDAAGLGALMIHHFVPGAEAGTGPRLARTLGPLLDVVPPDATTSLRRTPDGRRWIVTDFGEDHRVRHFDAQGGLALPPVETLIGLDLAALLALPAPPCLPARTVDGSPAPPGLDGPPADTLLGDLDGDGRPERLTRL